MAGFFVLCFDDVQIAINCGVVIMKKILIPIAMLMVISLSGCETMEGLGRDLQNLGDSVEEKASNDEWIHGGH